MENLKRIDNLTQSKSDNRQYLFKQLSNNLKVLIISDKDADKSAGAMNVNIGSLTDPEEFYGLAHFCEHMLFMGTEKYPSEDEYSEFLNSNSGNYNAFTDLDVTNYYFEIANDAFDEALDRFAQFFLKPLFVSDVVEREMKAVDSENKKNLQNDSWRFCQLVRSEAKGNSVFKKFSTGNLETLNKPHIRDALLEMHKKYYSSDLMSLVILSNKTLEEMEKLVDNLFSFVSKVENLELPAYDKVLPYDKDNCGYFYNIVPVKNNDILNFYWFLPSYSKFYKKKPQNYVTSILGHEGPNTLTSSLLKDDLISSLTSGSEIIASAYSTIYISLNLTKKGLENVAEVIRRTLYYVHIIQKQPVNKRFFDEISQINKMKFDFKNKEKPMSYTSDIAYYFKDYKPEDILTGPYLIEEYDEELIRQLIDSLTLDNLNIYLSSKTNESKCDLEEMWYRTKYSKEKFSEEFIKQHRCFDSSNVCEHNLDYPPENVFIPKTLEMHSLENCEKHEHPQNILNEDGVSIWYKRDFKFNLPKAIAICQIYLNKNHKHYHHYETVAYLWNSIVDNELKELSYMAHEANLNIKFHVNNEGMFLSVNGFNNSLANALYEITKKFKSISAHDKHEKLKVQVIRHIQEMNNFFLKAPYSVAIDYVEHLMIDPSLTAIDKLKILTKGVEIEELVEFVEELIKESHFEWLIQGNILYNEAVEIAKNVQSIISKNNLPKDKTFAYRTVLMEVNTNFIYSFSNVNKSEQNSAICTFLQSGKSDEKSSCILQVIESLLNDRFFNELRTRQSLGYIASLFYRSYRNNEGLMCVVQSSVKSPEFIWLRIKEFFDDSRNFVNELSDELFETHVNSVIVNKKQKDFTLNEEVNRNFTEIKKRKYVFDRKEQHVSILESLKKEELIQFYNHVFVQNLRRLDVEYVAHNHQEENNRLEEDNLKICEENKIKRIKVKSIEDFKRRNLLYQDFFYEES